MNLRQATSDDIPAIESLMRSSVRGLSTGFYNDAETAGAEAYITKPDPDVIADGTFYVIEDGARLVACGGWSRRKKLFAGPSDQETLSSDFLDPVDDPAKIRAFFIDPEYARQGLGRRLYEACREAALKAGFKSFELAATMPGVPFYRNLGFAEMEPIDAQLPDGSILPCLKMSRPI